jgi:drug/metabolite transporter (DMT)-like permease
LLAALILGERLTMAGIAGMALVFLGVGWFAFAERR